MDHRPEVVERGQEVRRIIDGAIARRRAWAWEPEVIRICHSRASGVAEKPQAIEVVFAEGLFTLRVPSELLSDAGAARLLSHRMGFGWTQYDDGGGRAGRAMCKDYLPGDMREAIDDILWLMCVLWKAPLAHPLWWQTDAATAMAQAD